MQFRKEQSTLLWTIGAASLTLALSQFALPKDVANAIKDRSGGRCEGCGQEVTFPRLQLTAAHIIHGDDRQGGLALCHRCEAFYHLEGTQDPSSIGMTRTNADTRGWQAVSRIRYSRCFRRN